MKALFVLLSLLLALTSLQASVKVKSVDITWAAFKTPAKVAVKGSFTKTVLDAKNSLVGTTLSIDTRSVASGNAGRDVKLVKFYFDLFSQPNIKGEIVSKNGGTVVIAISMNGVTKNINFKAEEAKSGMHLKGTIDMLGFGLSKALKSINQACFELHKGKTWSDVDLDIHLNL